MNATTSMRIDLAQAWRACYRAGQRAGRRWGESHAELLDPMLADRGEPPLELRGVVSPIGDAPTLSIVAASEPGRECLLLQEACRCGFAGGVAWAWELAHKEA